MKHTCPRCIIPTQKLRVTEDYFYYLRTSVSLCFIFIFLGTGPLKHTYPYSPLSGEEGKRLLRIIFEYVGGPAGDVRTRIQTADLLKVVI